MAAPSWTPAGRVWPLPAYAIPAPADSPAPVVAADLEPPPQALSPFPQATPASRFPPAGLVALIAVLGVVTFAPHRHVFPSAISDFYKLDEMLKPEERAIRLRVRAFMEKEVAPIMAEVRLSSKPVDCCQTAGPCSRANFLKQQPG
eukprot:SM004380S16076  [mRNA]  locus=s4380:278:949:- [translate_table: standard]